MCLKYGAKRTRRICSPSFLAVKSMRKCLSLFGIEFMSGRSSEAPQLSGLHLDVAPIRRIRSPKLHNPLNAKTRNKQEPLERAKTGINGESSSIAEFLFARLIARALRKSPPDSWPCPSVPSPRRFGQGGVLAYNGIRNVSQHATRSGHLDRQVMTLMF